MSSLPSLGRLVRVFVRPASHTPFCHAARRGLTTRRRVRLARSTWGSNRARDLFHVVVIKLNRGALLIKGEARDCGSRVPGRGRCNPFPLSLDTMSASFLPAELALVSQIFARYDPAKTGFITGENAVKVFNGTKLTPSTLGLIWNIADEEDKGKLSRTGVAIAVRLIGWAQKGEKIIPELAQRRELLSYTLRRPLIVPSGPTRQYRRIHKRCPAEHRHIAPKVSPTAALSCSYPAR